MRPCLSLFMRSPPVQVFSPTFRAYAIYSLTLHATKQQAYIMTYNFDTPVDRNNTDCVSVELMKQATGRNDLIPLWVADMDFPTPPFVIKAIGQKLKQQILGYTCAPESYFRCIMDWNKRRCGFDIPRNALHHVPGIVPGIYFAVNCLTEKGDKIMIETPVYHPFGNVTRGSGRTCVEVPLILDNGRYRMDYDEIDRLLPECKLFILCNPHNPGGTSWSRDELTRLVKLCKRHGVLIVSDEIHADMTFNETPHVPTAASCPEAEDITVTFMAPTKAFNLPGVVASHTIVVNPTLRRRFFTYLDSNDIGNGNVFAYKCVEACYSAEGEEWLTQMLRYVRGNIKFVTDFLAANCPKITAVKPEASFLMFLDNRRLNLASQQELTDFYTNDAALYLNDGAMFGKPGTGFMRLNVGQPRCIIEKAMNRLAAAYKKRNF